MEIEPQNHGIASTSRPFIYVRSATNDDGQLQQRLEDACELAHMNGLDVAQDDCIAEHGSGASIEGRPGLLRILEQATRGEISHLVTPRASYLSRNSRDLHRILAALAEAGVVVVTASGVDVLGVEYKAAKTMLVAR